MKKKLNISNLWLDANHIRLWYGVHHVLGKSVLNLPCPHVILQVLSASESAGHCRDSSGRMRTLRLCIGACSSEVWPWAGESRPLMTTDARTEHVPHVSTDVWLGLCRIPLGVQPHYDSTLFSKWGAQNSNQ